MEPWKGWRGPTLDAFCLMPIRRRVTVQWRTLDAAPLENGGIRGYSGAGVSGAA